jgi:hypothetical protein
VELEISLQVKNPIWGSWESLSAVKLREAILLSLDVCPIWYEDYIVGNVQLLNSDIGEYKPDLPDYEIRSICEVYDAVESEILNQLKIIKSWFHKSSWLIGEKPLSPEHISLSSNIDLRAFIKSAINEICLKDLPSMFLLLADEGGSISMAYSKSEPNIVSATADWITLGRAYAKDHMESYRGKSYTYGTQRDVAVKVYKYLDEKNIFTSKGKQPDVEYIIRNLLRADGWWKENHFWKPSLD